MKFLHTINKFTNEYLHKDEVIAAYMQIRSFFIAIGVVLLAICLFIVISSSSAIQQAGFDKAQNTRDTNAIQAAQKGASPVVEPLLQKTMRITLIPQNNSGGSGLVTVEEVVNKTRITIQLTGVPVEIHQPAHFHTGTCETPGEIVFSLNDVIDGRSQTDLDVSLAEFQKQLPLIVNVHESARNLSTYIACGVSD